MVAVEVGDELLAYHGASRAVVRLNAAGARAWRDLPRRSEDHAEAELLLDLHRLGFLT